MTQKSKDSFGPNVAIEQSPFHSTLHEITETAQVKRLLATMQER